MLQRQFAGATPWPRPCGRAARGLPGILGRRPARSPGSTGPTQGSGNRWAGQSWLVRAGGRCSSLLHASFVYIIPRSGIASWERFSSSVDRCARVGLTSVRPFRVLEPLRGPPGWRAGRPWRSSRRESWGPIGLPSIPIRVGVRDFWQPGLGKWQPVGWRSPASRAGLRESSFSGCG